MSAMWRIIELAILSALCISSGNGSKILMLPVIAHSHISSMQSISHELIRRGHQVTMLVQEGVPVREQLQQSNPSGIIIERLLFDKSEEKFNHEDMQENMMKLILEDNIDMKQMFVQITTVFGAECRRLAFYNEPLFDRLKNTGFDIAIVDAIFSMKCYYLVPHRLGIPWITYTDFLNPLLAGVPIMPSFVPHGMTTFNDKMSFYQRLQNTFMWLFFVLTDVVPDPTKEILDRFRIYGAFDSLNDLESKSLLWFTTKDILIDYPRPSMPNIVDLGGLTVKPATGGVTKELDSFMSSAKKGAILVTFGSNVVTLPAAMANKFLIAFGKLTDYKIIWRLKNKDNLEVPNNVMLSTWLPQNDLLADQRVKLFITHSGNNGQLEAIYHGVPMIGFPLFGDQMYNGARLPAKGYGINMDIHHFTVEELLDNIFKIVNDPTYKARTMKASKIFKTRRETAAETAAYWIEHVIEFGGEHLRSGGRKLNYIQYYMLDILALILCTVSVLLVVVYVVLKIIVRKCKGKNMNDTKRKLD